MSTIDSLANRKTSGGVRNSSNYSNRCRNSRETVSTGNAAPGRLAWGDGRRCRRPSCGSFCKRVAGFLHQDSTALMGTVEILGRERERERERFLKKRENPPPEKKNPRIPRVIRSIRNHFQDSGRTSKIPQEESSPVPRQNKDGRNLIIDSGQHYSIIIQI